MKVLITGFDGFNGEDINPSSLVLERLAIKEVNIEKLFLETSFEKSSKVLEEKIKSFRPHILISLGQAGGRSDISIERVAINIDDASIKDNDGKRPVDKKIREDGESAYFSSLPIKAIVKDLKDKKIPASISNTAGTYVCNHVMYEGLYLSKKYENMSSGFIHLPYLPDQVLDKRNTASMGLDMMVRAVETIIKTSIKYYGRPDLKKAYGKLD